MALTRRQFLKTLGIGALGAVLSNCDGLEQALLSELSEPNLPHSNHYSMAFIMLGKDSSDFTDLRYGWVEGAKTDFPDTFHEATEGLASMDTSYDIVDMFDDGTMIVAQDQIDQVQVVRKFYEEHPDEFDFISIYPVYTSMGNNMYHSFVQNKIEGIGLPVIDYTADYGTNGRLLGINCQHTHLIQNEIPLDTAPISLQNGLLHETGHQWGVFVGDNFSADPNAQLEIKQQGMHFYRGLESPFTNGTAMNSDHWVPNGDGTFRRENEFGIQKYHPFQLYFMGLLNEDNYDFDRKFEVFNAGVVGQDFNSNSAVPYREVSIRDIINIEGTRREIQI